jgi:hypothetical protein
LCPAAAQLTSAFCRGDVTVFRDSCSRFDGLTQSRFQSPDLPANAACALPTTDRGHVASFVKCGSARELEIAQDAAESISDLTKPFDGRVHYT